MDAHGFKCNIYMINYNGKFLTHENKNPSMLNRAFSFGDGIFETIIATKNQVYHFDLHWIRLLEGLAVLGLDFQLSKDELEQQILSSLQRFDDFQNLFRVKVYVWRAGEGKYTPLTNACDYLIEVKEFTHQGSQIIEKCGISKKVTLFPTLLSALKTISALNYVLASKEKSDLNLEEILLLNHDGKMVEASSANIFIYSEKDHVFYTPAISEACIDGTIRKLFLTKLPELGYTVKEIAYKPQDLNEDHAVFLTNVSGVRQLMRIQNIQLSGNKKMLEKLSSLLPY